MQNSKISYKNLGKALLFFAETSHTFSTYQCLQKDVWDFLNFM